MGEITGVRLWTVRADGGKGDLLDLRFAFTIKVGHGIVMYAFDKSSSKQTQARANAAMEKAAELSKSKDGVKVIGTDATTPNTAQIPVDFVKLVPKDEGPARILIGKSDGKGHFVVRISIDQPKGSDSVAVEVPFDGNLPDSLKSKRFDGEAFLVTAGSQDVAKTLLAGEVR